MRKLKDSGLEDYFQLQQDNENKNGRWTYRGIWYVFGITGTKLMIFKLIILLLSILQILFVVLLGGMNSPGLRKIYIVLPYLAVLLISGVELWNAIYLIFQKDRLTRRQYERNYLCLKRSASMQIIACSVLITAELIFFYLSAFAGSEVISMTEVFAVIVCAFYT